MDGIFSGWHTEGILGVVVVSFGRFKTKDTYPLPPLQTTNLRSRWGKGVPHLSPTLWWLLATSDIPLEGHQKVLTPKYAFWEYGLFGGKGD